MKKITLALAIVLSAMPLASFGENLNVRILGINQNGKVDIAYYWWIQQC